jgi:hypothetical protein
MEHPFTRGFNNKKRVILTGIFSVEFAALPDISVGVIRRDDIDIRRKPPEEV